jgi:hypothetical protein
LEKLISELAGKLLKVSKSGMNTKTAEKILKEAQKAKGKDPEKGKRP